MASRLKRSAGVRPFAYRQGKSLVHRLPGGLKLLGLFFISALIFISEPPLSAAGKLTAAVLILSGAFTAAIRPWELFRGIRPLLVMLSFVLAFRSVTFNSENLPIFDTEGFLDGLVFAVQILLSFAASALLFCTTTMTELRASLEKAEAVLTYPFVSALRPLKQEWAQNLRAGLERRHLSLGIALMLGFMRKFFEHWENANCAWEARSGRGGINRITVLIPLLTERMIRSAAETAQAIEARGYGEK
ncbi:MAG: energy-coupling factor transporter transmembrane protein EcfT [Treponema sp.]|jgi:biotin transport system permease protein|nr:energy-coupling factor transporter transmembrane protein EcfT [Treponema sp.]